MKKYYDIPRMLPGGIAIYPKKGPFPPPDMEGYQRKSNNPRSVDAWIFIPLWQYCPYRQRKVVPRDEGCKCTRIVMICGLKDCEYYDLPTTLKSCEECLLRQSHQHESFVQLSLSESIGEGIMMVDKGDAEVLAKSPKSETIKGNFLSPENSPISNTEGK